MYRLKEERMKNLGMCVALLVLTIWSSGLAQVTPEAQKLLDQAVHAHGGRAAIEGLRTLTQTGVDRFMSTDGTWLEGGYRRIFDFSKRQFRIEDFRDGFIQGVRQFTADGGVRWTSEGGIQSMSSTNEPVDFQELKVLLMPLKSATVVGPQTVQGMTGMAFRLTLNNPDLHTFTYLLASDGSVLARAEGSEMKSDGELDAFGDYRTVAGVRIPYQYRYFENGKLVYEEKTLEVQVNPEINASMFKLPPTETPPANIGATLESSPRTGIKVTGVTPGGPAAKAGLQIGDLILEVNGASMANWNHLLQNGIPGQPGTVMVLNIRRDGKTLKINITRELP
jgi:PDZ domain